MRAQAYVTAWRQALEPEADPERAAAQKRYMRDQFDYVGLATPKLEALMRKFLAEYGPPDPAELEAVVRELWGLPQREYQYVALRLLAKARGKSGAAERLALLEELITAKSWWDTVDLLASNHVGPLLARHPELIGQAVSAWMASGNMWLQRTALLFQLKYKSRTDVILLFGLIRELAGSKEFFLQKAIGWALREYSKTAPEQVREFVEREPLAPLSRREALKGLQRAEAQAESG